jgi:hypothetical protein
MWTIALPKASRLTAAGCDLGLAVVLVTLANLPFWVLAWSYFLSRPVFNADAALALAGASLGATGMALCLIVAWALDATQAMSLAYHFHSTPDFAAAAKYVQLLHVGDFFSMPVIAVGLLFTAVTFAMVMLARLRRPRVWALVAVTGALVAVDVANGSGLPALLGSDRVRLSLNVQGSPLLNLVSASLHAREQASAPLANLPAGDTPMPEVVDWAWRHPDGRVLIVLVESWGWHVDPALRAWTARALTLAGDGQTQRFDVRMTSVPFRGSTTAGELRTLCGLSGHYSRLNAAQAARCLPNQLAAMGFDSVGLHGFSSRMFERHHWWPMLGLSRSIFIEDMAADAPRCGSAFEGACDAHLLALAAAELKPRRLVYALTLNTHLPLKSMVLPPDLQALCRARRTSEAVCQLTGQLQQVLEQVAAVIARTRGPALIVVAGDHSPPFLRDSDRQAFSPTDAPSVILIPR